MKDNCTRCTKSLVDKKSCKGLCMSCYTTLWRQGKIEEIPKTKIERTCKDCGKVWMGSTGGCKAFLGYCRGCAQRNRRKETWVKPTPKQLICSRCNKIWESKTCENTTGLCIKCYKSDWQKENGNRAHTSWRRRNVEHVRAYARAAGRLWRENHPEHKPDPEKRKIAVKKYQQSERGRLKHRLSQQKRRLWERSGSFTFDEFIEMKKVQNGCCFYCHIECEILEVEHMIPRCRGGLHTKDNIVLSCGPCNRKKGSKDAAEFTAVTLGGQ